MIGGKVCAAAVGVSAPRGEFLEIMAGARTPGRSPPGTTARISSLFAAIAVNASPSMTSNCSERLFLAAGRF